MDRLDEYRQFIENILDSYAQIPYPYGQVKNSVIVDREQNNFLLIHEGWQGPQRIHGCIVHVEIRDGRENLDSTRWYRNGNYRRTCRIRSA
ncbi:element excision factor XisI family protein [Microcoleus sp. Pol11C3]|uniref:element excision factor XisI family protein n=1 Tax=Microcoleus sp. Pol11C3 TaxID=3055390 RepID=UPI004040AF69